MAIFDYDHVAVNSVLEFLLLSLLELPTVIHNWALHMDRHSYNAELIEDQFAYVSICKVTE